jgi:hypothetical protein
MVRLIGPLCHFEAHGWLGRYQYATKGLVRNAYPISFLPFISQPYRMPAFPFRPYPPFIFRYYSPKGWCYQLRRTWHGIIWSAIAPPISAQPKTPAQEANKTKFGDGVRIWQSMNQETKDYYVRLRFPVHASGYNRFLHYYMLGKP